MNRRRSLSEFARNKTLATRPARALLLWEMPRRPPRAPPPQLRQAPQRAQFWPRSRDENIPDSEKTPFRRPEWDERGLIALAWENGWLDVLAYCGIYVFPEEPRL